MKAAIYCRLSEEDRNKTCAADDSGSIQNQKALLMKYAAEQGWELYSIYSDDDYTGADRSRPAFKKLLQDAQQRKFDIILCKTQSRFTRELELVEKYIHGLFPVWGIRFVSIVDNADTANRGNKKSRQINGLVNEWYLEDLSENIRSVLINRRQNGFHIGSFALYGYKKDPDKKGHLLIDEEAAAVVREVFTLFAQGYGKTAIARSLNDRGIPNPTEYKRLHGLRYHSPKGKTGTLWKYFSIANMLTNEIYIGNMVQGKYGSISYKTRKNRPRPKEDWYIVQGTHEPIIELELWNQVQALISKRVKPFSNGSIGLFAGKARCISCGYTMRSSKSRGKHYLLCPNHHISKDACTGAFIAVDQLEQMVLEELRHLSEQYLDLERLEKSISLPYSLQTQKRSLCSDIFDCEQKIAQYSRWIRTLYLDRAGGLLSERDYITLSEEFVSGREKQERKLEELKEKLVRLEKKNDTEENACQRLIRYVNPERLTREMVERLINYIYVGRRIPKSRQVPIEIYWNF